MHKFRFATLFVWLLALVSANQSLLAQQTVTYSVSFSGNWTTASTPGGVVGGAHFTTIAGASHTSSASYWRVGSSATSGLEALAEFGSTSGFLAEIRASNQYLDTISASPGGGGTGSARFTVRVSRTHPAVTLASMIGPSPDWFVGLSGRSLLDSSQNWVESVSINLYPYDAGTEDGNGFSLSNPDTSPRGVIHSIRGRSPFSNEPMARITFKCTDCDSTPPLPPTLPPLQADPPFIKAIERPSGAASLTNANSVSWIVSFNESVRNVSADDFTVFGTTASVTSLSGSGSSYTATVSGGNLASLNASISLGLSSGQNIENSSGTKLSTTLPTINQGYSIDNRGPRVSSVTPRQATSSPFTLSITFNESLQPGALSGSGDVSSSAASISTPRGSGLTYTVVVTPRNSDTAATIPISIQAGAGIDLAGNSSSAYQTTIDFRPGDPPVDPDPETDDPQDPESEPDDPDQPDPNEPDPEPDPPSPQNPESTAASIVKVNALSPNGIYHLGDRIEVAVQFDMPVSVTGSPTLELKFAEGSRIAAYERNMASTILVFGYTVAAGDSTDDLAYSGTGSLALAGGSIIGENSAEANLKLPEPGEQGSLSASSAIVTTGRENAVPSFESETIEDRSFYMGVPIEPIVLPSATGGDFSLTYEITPALPDGLNLDATKNHITGTSTVFMDATMFTWTATDADGDSVRLMFKMTILEKVPLVFDGTAAIGDRVFIQYEVIEPITLPSASGGVGELTYSLTPALPAGLSVDIGAGQITGTPTVELAQTEYTWRVVDEFDGDRAITFELTVLLDEQPMFAADAMVDDRIFKQDAMIEPISLPRASGGNGYLHYELSPDLPDGLNLDEAQLVISGSPATAQMETKYVWSVVDEDRDTASIEFSLEVVQVDELMFKTQLEVSNFEYIQSSEIDPIQLSMVQGGYGEYAYSLMPALPDGLILDTAYKISGTPTQPMSATTYTWQATDFFGDTVAFEFTITIVMDEFPSFGENAVVSAMSFIEDSGIMTFSLPRAMGGNGELKHSLQPELPPGLSLDTDAFTIGGTPTAAFETTEFTWQVTDIDGDMDTVQFMLSVDADLMPQFDASAVSFEKTFTQYSEIETISLPNATGGNGELTFTLTPPLVDGLTLAINERTITGTPTEWRDRTMHTWTVRDIDGDSKEFTFHLTISEDLQPSFAAGATIASASYITDSTIEPFTLPTATGGNGALTYDLSPNLPNGIRLDTSTFEIAGTPLESLAMSRFDWTVTDADGDSVALHFYLTVDQDEQPQFTGQVADQIFVAETAITPIQLPDATSGNGDLSYTLTPSPGNGLVFDASTATIAGTPLDEAPNQTFTWTVADIDGDSTSLMFDILVQPASPETTGTLANARLFVGGSTQTIDANNVFRGRIDTWSIEIADSNVASLAIDAPGVLTLTPRFEGQTTVSIAVANVTGSAATSFMVSVDTAAAELSHIDSTLSLNASAALGSVMNVFKKRSQTRASEPHGSSTSLNVDSAQDWGFSSWHQRPSSNVEFHQHSITRFDQSRSIAGQQGVSSIPLNFSHTATSWSLWGAMDLQSLSSHDDEIDGSMNSLFLGADYTLGANTFAGLALARHAGSSTYQFTSADANGEGSLDTNLIGFYPYLQHGDGNRYSLYIVGGRASGDIDIDRSHAHGTDLSADGELSVLGAGLGVVLWRRSALDISLVGDAGTASLSSSAESGILNDREGESSRFSFGASFAFNQTMETGQMALAADLRGVNEGGEESSSGLEMGVNLNFIGEHMDFMLDARRVAGSSDIERVRNSASARLRYQARVNGSGLTASISNRWQDHWFEPNYNVSHLSEQTLLSPFGSSVGRSLETKVGYGFWTNREIALFEPRIKWIDAAQGASEIHIGAVCRTGPMIQGTSSLSVDLIRPMGRIQNAAPGMALRLALPL